MIEWYELMLRPKTGRSTSEAIRIVDKTNTRQKHRILGNFRNIWMSQKSYTT
jgi:hypothetical protein